MLEANVLMLRLCLGVVNCAVHVIVQPEHPSRAGGDGCAYKPLG